MPETASTVNSRRSTGTALQADVLGACRYRWPLTVDRSRGSTLVVRLPPQDRPRPVPLLHHHDPRQLVREGERPEAPARRGTPHHLGVEAERPADEERGRHAALEPSLQPPGQLLAAPRRAPAVERHDVGPLRHRVEQRARFLALPERRAPRVLRLPDFPLDQRAVAAKPVEILVADGPVGGPELPHGKEMGIHPFSLLATRSLLAYAYIPRSRCTPATRSIATMYAAIRMLTLVRLAIAATSWYEVTMIFSSREFTVSRSQK